MAVYVSCSVGLLHWEAGVSKTYCTKFRQTSRLENLLPFPRASLETPKSMIILHIKRHHTNELTVPPNMVWFRWARWPWCIFYQAVYMTIYLRLSEEQREETEGRVSISVIFKYNQHHLAAWELVVFHFLERIGPMFALSKVRMTTTTGPRTE